MIIRKPGLKIYPNLPMPPPDKIELALKRVPLFTKANFFELARQVALFTWLSPLTLGGKLVETSPIFQKQNQWEKARGENPVLVGLIIYLDQTRDWEKLELAWWTEVVRLHLTQLFECRPPRFPELLKGANGREAEKIILSHAEAVRQSRQISFSALVCHKLFSVPNPYAPCLSHPPLRFDQIVF